MPGSSAWLHIKVERTDGLGGETKRPGLVQTGNAEEESLLHINGDVGSADKLHFDVIALQVMPFLHLG